MNGMRRPEGMLGRQPPSQLELPGCIWGPAVRQYPPTRLPACGPRPPSRTARPILCSAGAGVGFKAGRGFAIAKVDGRWSCPCFVTTGGVAVGAIAGVEKVGGWPQGWQPLGQACPPARPWAG